MTGAGPWTATVRSDVCAGRAARPDPPRLVGHHRARASFLPAENYAVNDKSLLDASRVRRVLGVLAKVLRHRGALSGRSGASPFVSFAAIVACRGRQSRHGRQVPSGRSPPAPGAFADCFGNPLSGGNGPRGGETGPVAGKQVLRQGNRPCSGARNRHGYCEYVTRSRNAGGSVAGTKWKEYLTLIDECQIIYCFLGLSHFLKRICNENDSHGWRVPHFYVTCRHTPSRRTALCGGRNHSRRRRAMVSPALRRRGSVGRHGLLATMVYCHGNGMSWKCAFLGS